MRGYTTYTLTHVIPESDEIGFTPIKPIAADTITTFSTKTPSHTNTSNTGSAPRAIGKERIQKFRAEKHKVSPRR